MLSVRAGLALVAVALLCGGCNFKHPAGTRTGAPVDQGYVGVWRAEGGKEGEEPADAVVTRRSASTLAVSFAGIEFEAYHIDLPYSGSDIDLFETKTQGGLGDLLPYSVLVLARYDIGLGEALLVLSLSPPPEGGLDTPEKVRAYAERSLASLPDLSDPKRLAEAASLPTWKAHLFTRKDGPRLAPSSPAAQRAPAPAGNAPKSSHLESLLVDCEQGSAESCGQLGYRYLHGLDVAKDAMRGSEFLERACNGGHGPSCTRLALAEMDKDRARSLAKRGCDLGEPVGCTEYGDLSPSAATAAPYYKRACKGGDAAGCETLGDMCFVEFIEEACTLIDDAMLETIMETMRGKRP